MLKVTITMEDSAGIGPSRRSVAFVRISEPSDGSSGWRVFAVERARPRIREAPRVAACGVPVCATGGEPVLSLLARVCGELAKTGWAEL